MWLWLWSLEVKPPCGRNPQCKSISANLLLGSTTTTTTTTTTTYCVIINNVSDYCKEDSVNGILNETEQKELQVLFDETEDNMSHVSSSTVCDSGNVTHMQLLHCTGPIYTGTRWNVSSFYECQFDFWGGDGKADVSPSASIFFKRNKL
jgi:hypothetical protein